MATPTGSCSLPNAATLSLWIWDPESSALHPALTYGYSHDVLVRLPDVPADADNALGAAFRSNGPCIVPGSQTSPGAVVVPLHTPHGCEGVFAVEFRNGGEHRECEQPHTVAAREREQPARLLLHTLKTIRARIGREHRE